MRHQKSTHVQDDTFDNAALVWHVSYHCYHRVLIRPNQRWTKHYCKVASVHLQATRTPVGSVTVSHRHFTRHFICFSNTTRF